MSSAAPRLPVADVIIVAYKSSDVIEAATTSLLGDPAVAHIHVVDNSPAEPLGLAPQERITIHRPQRNLGFGKGVNFAANAVCTEFVVIANPDTVTAYGTVRSCVSFLADHPDVALVSPRVFVDDKLFPVSERTPSLLRLLSYPMKLNRWFGLSYPLARHAGTHETQALNGAFLVARRTALTDVGWFDPSIFLFGEETDLCRKVREAGYSVVFLAEGRVDHVDGLSSDRATAIDIDALRRAARVEQLRRHRGACAAAIYEMLLRTLHRPSI